MKPGKIRRMWMRERSAAKELARGLFLERNRSNDLLTKLQKIAASVEKDRATAAVRESLMVLAMMKAPIQEGLANRQDIGMQFHVTDDLLRYYRGKVIIEQNVTEAIWRITAVVGRINSLTVS